MGLLMIIWISSLWKRFDRLEEGDFLRKYSATAAVALSSFRERKDLKEARRTGRHILRECPSFSLKEIPWKTRCFAGRTPDETWKISPFAVDENWWKIKRGVAPPLSPGVRNLYQIFEFNDISLGWIEQIYFFLSNCFFRTNLFIDSKEEERGD